MPLITGVTGQQGSDLAERRRTPAAPVEDGGQIPMKGGGPVAGKLLNVQVEATPTPEARTFLLWGTTAVGLAAVRRWRKKARAA